ncbi:hypothetical protein FA15DRAFT_751438 [Coprinopsis marcescibilis]|uniref:Spc7 kinetochore protein domain-containing protein n=1 Tax=Coprinopsis marcescibilis TaxID=230819 RepID=A0A5C3LBE6_COPMA|nr:hypothetical protein FA15DRAFT_751438 [Coprinopsis marcescibilis]
MVVTKDSPHRRRSLAALGHSKPTEPRRRRAHSVAFRTSLSPQAKARRLLVPRKSILKTSFTPDDAEDEDETQSMEFTQDYRARVHDNTSRKSLNRRVSFADHAHVRVFQIPNSNHTNSTASPQSSPASEPSSDPEVPPPQQFNDENDYPAADFARRRRSSLRFSTGSDMDLTSVGHNLTDSPGIGAAILDEDFDDMDMEMSDDMEVTQIVQGSSRRRSVAPRRETLGHPPSAILQMDEDEANQTQSSIADDSIISDAPEDESQAMEFTVPMGKSLRPPAHEDEAWLALRQATHSGDTSIEPQDESFEENFHQAGREDMAIPNAVERLLRARQSLSRQNNQDDTTDNLGELQDDTVSSVGSIENNDSGDRTMNLSRVIGRASLGGDLNSRMSMGYGETSMDESEVYGNIVAARRQSMASSQQTSNEVPTNGTKPPSVFHPPPPSEASTSTTAPNTTAVRPAGPKVFSLPPVSPLVNRPAPSPSKAKGKPTFTAAFAPPSTKPSPKKVPSKRQVDESDIENHDADQPSPAKRQALAGKWKEQAQTHTPAAPTTTVTSPKPRPLSPSKKAMFQAPVAETAPRPQPTLRQPTGYMARRKSLAPNMSSQSSNAEPSPNPRRRLGAGRASMGSASQDAWKRFDKNSAKRAVQFQMQEEPSQPSPSEEVQEPEHEAAREQIPPRRSPSPTAPNGTEVDLSTTLDVPTYGAESEEEVSPLDKAARWRANVAGGDYEDEDAPAISIAQFFEMTGIKFMDEITAPRRSMHPAQHGSRRPRPPQEIGLAEYAVSMAIDIPQLELFTRVSRDLQAWMEKSKVSFQETEEEAAKVTPELFVEYSRADEEDQASLMHQLNFIKSNTRGKAKSDWYDWKLKWVEGLKATADKAFADLESDARKLEALNAAAHEVIPGLEQDYADIMEELEREQAEVKEIDESDQDYLNELKASIAEQNIEVDALKAEVTESKEQLSWLKERLRETEQQKQEVSAAIAKADRILQIQKSSTRAEVFQLKDELEALEDLHSTRIIKVNSHYFEYIYDSTYQISIPCSNFTPIVSKISINRLERSRTLYKDDFPKLTNLFLACAKEILDDTRDQTVRQIVHRLGDYWTSCNQLRSQLRLLNIKYPIEVQIVPPSTSEPTPSFHARTTVMIPKQQGKAIVSFIFNLQAFSEWPISIDSLICEVDVAYGNLDRSAILEAVAGRLAQATADDNYALLDSCIDAQALYN